MPHQLDGGGAQESRVDGMVVTVEKRDGWKRRRRTFQDLRRDERTMEETGGEEKATTDYGLQRQQGSGDTVAKRRGGRCRSGQRDPDGGGGEARGSLVATESDDEDGSNSDFNSTDWRQLRGRR